MSHITSIPLAFVRDHLVNQESAPLPPLSQASLNRALGCDMSGVRTYVGPSASRLCGLLQADALVINGSIVFAEGRYAPQTAAGQRLLAHEAIHLLQQRQSKQPTSGLVQVGNPQDPYEVEADRLAEELLGGSFRTIPTPDTSGAIRRTFTVLPSANVTREFRGAIPGVSYTSRGAVDIATFHLTRNSAAIKAGTMRKQADGSAINLGATISVISDNPKEDLASSDLRFRFLQFFGLTDQRAFYAGVLPTEGTMFLDFASSPAFSGAGDLMLDSESSSRDFPYYEMYPPRFVRVNSNLWAVTITMDDHPFNDLPLVLPNFAAGNKRNFLCTAYKRFNVVTVVLVRDYTDPGKPTLTALSQINWGAEVGCRIRWSQTSDSLEPRPPEFTTRDFYCDDPLPTVDPDLVTKIKNLDFSSQTYNDAADAAYKTVVGSTFNTRNTRAFERWDSAKIGEFFGDD
jgi:hypothetical protein